MHVCFVKFVNLRIVVLCSKCVDNMMCFRNTILQDDTKLNALIVTSTCCRLQQAHHFEWFVIVHVCTMPNAHQQANLQRIVIWGFSL